jgi:hypothetical protein
MSKNSKLRNFFLAFIKIIYKSTLFSMKIFCLNCRKYDRNHENWKCRSCQSNFIEIVQESDIPRQIPPSIPLNSTNVIVKQPRASRNSQNFSRPPMQIPLPPTRPELFVTSDGLIVSKPQNTTICQNEISRRQSKINPTVLKNPLSCTICLENVSSPAGTLPCKHSFHYFCIKKWIEQKPNCPLYVLCSMFISGNLDPEVTSLYRGSWQAS